MSRITKILMDRDGLTQNEAEELIMECKQALHNGEWDAMQTYLGLEDDYIFDLM